MSFEPRKYPFLANQEEIYHELYPISFQQQRQCPIQTTIISESSEDFSDSESPTNELEVCKVNLEKSIKNINDDV
ncbi:17417_t:CDS:2, partial [Dentiscutata heterogama]